jgi:hypothetical protein
MNPATLENTVAEWNDDLKRGEDTQFHRPIRAPRREAGASHQPLFLPRSGLVLLPQTLIVHFCPMVQDFKSKSIPLS